MGVVGPGWGALTGGLAGLTFIAVCWLGQWLAGLPFLPFDLFDWLSRTLPGAVITFGIDMMVAVIRGLRLGPTAAAAKAGEQGLALVLVVVTGIVVGVVLALAGRRRPQALPALGLAAGLLLLVPMIVAEVTMGLSTAGIVWPIILLPGGGYLLGRVLRAKAGPTAAETPEEAEARRKFLWLAGLGSFTVIVGAVGARLIAGGGEESAGPVTTAAGTGTPPPTGAPPGAVPPTAPEAQAGRIPPAPGTRPELTPDAEFYRIDIDLRPPEVDARAWRLKVGGLVKTPMALTLEDLRSRASVRQPATLSCISNPVGGDLISTTVWTGTPLGTLLVEAGVDGRARAIAVKSVDGFYESIPIEEARDERTLLVYEMNGEPLAPEHGFPLRVIIPGRYGMKQPKWIESMEAIAGEGRGYWVDRGWDERAVVRTTSAVDPPPISRRAATPPTIPVGGIAYAGDRGIRSVEVRVDEGPWEPASLRVPPLGPLTWVQWRYDWKASPGKHTIRVRAADGEGRIQDQRERPPHPAGATGYHAVDISVPGKRGRD